MGAGVLASQFSKCCQGDVCWQGDVRVSKCCQGDVCCHQGDVRVGKCWQYDVGVSKQVLAG